jgi:hypothetical protein
MIEPDYEKMNKERDLKLYRDILEILEKRFQKEYGVNLQNAKLVVDGLTELMINKQKELNSLENKSKEEK